MIAPGTVLQNRYLVERQIGQGGMGAVYIATDQRFGSTVALKETFFDDPNMRKAFEREAKLLNHLRHTALPRVSDHFNEGDGQFLVMEYMPGEDLSGMLKARGAPFAVRDVLAWADQLLDALDYLHTKTPSVIHRDIKPQNLKLMPRNQIVLLDFGLAKGTPLQTRVTATGSVFGYSFNYAPIEQMQGTGTDPRSDLYSLGATVYHFLTNTTPPDALTRATALVNGDPDPLRSANELNARVPSEVADVLTRALQQSAARRFASAEEMRAALREAAKSVGEEAEEDAGAAGATTNALAAGTAFASEQETQLLEGEGGGGVTSPLASSARGTEAVGSDNAATLFNTQMVRNETAGRDENATAAGNAKTAAQIPESAGREDDSVATRVRIADAPTTKRGGSRRALGLAAGVLVVALVAAGVYSFTNRGVQVAPETQPTPRAQATGQPAAMPSPQPTAENQQAPAAVASPTREATAQQQRPAPNVKNEKPREATPPVVETNPPTPPAPRTQPEPDVDSEDDDAIFRNRDWVNNPITDEEIRRLAEQRPRRARLLRQRIKEDQRRRGNNTRPPSTRSPRRRPPP